MKAQIVPSAKASKSLFYLTLMIINATHFLKNLKINPLSFKRAKKSSIFLSSRSRNSHKDSKLKKKGTYVICVSKKKSTQSSWIAPIDVHAITAPLILSFAQFAKRRLKELLKYIRSNLIFLFYYINGFEGTCNKLSVILVFIYIRGCLKEKVFFFQIIFIIHFSRFYYKLILFSSLTQLSIFKSQSFFREKRLFIKFFPINYLIKMNERQFINLNACS